MNWQWLLLYLTCHTYINSVENKEIVGQINTKRLIHYVPDRFLSMTIDPTSIFLAGNLEQKALKMARGLYPSFVRLGGKATNYLKFGKELFVDNNTITEGQWDGVNNFVEDAGLDLIVSLNPTHRVESVWDSRDALQLISYSDKHGYNVAWQLGYDTQGHLETGSEVGRDIIRLRKILDGFQRYATAPVFGPDLPDVYTLKESAFIKDLLVQAGPVLGAMMVQLPFNNENPEQKIANILFNMESHIWSREIRYGRMIPKKPIWIAEKNPSHGKVEDAINLLKYLGAAAQIGCQMVFRQVGPESLKNPTPDYWLALLYKNLVGRGVFDAKVTSGNKSEIVLFSHCSQTISPDRSILDTGFNYDKGSVTVFGVNESPETIKLTLKASMKDEKAHIYFLTFEDNPDEKTEKTFLNGQLLTSSPSGDLPVISPKIKRTIKNGINVPSRSIFFIVLPDLKSRTCTFPNSYLNPDVQSLSKKLIHVVADALEKPSNDLKSDEEDPQNVYVKFAKSTGVQNLPNSDNKPSQVPDDSEPDVQVKYITFNDNSWLSKLTETMGNPKVFEQPDENATNGNNENKYTTLTAAITGSDNLTDIPLTESAPAIDIPESPNQQKRKRRSVNEQSSIDTEALTASDKHSIASQEDLVKHLNNFASHVYKKSQKDGSNKEIKISNIPPEIFNTLKNVKVTFKNLGEEHSPKDEADKRHRNESPLHAKPDNSKDTTPLNGFLFSNDESFDPIILDSEKSIINPSIARNKEIYNYKVETLKNKSPTDIIQKYIKRFGENQYQESNGPIKKTIDPLIVSEPFLDNSKEVYQGRISKQQDLDQHSIEINDRPQEEIQAEMDEKYTGGENIPSEILVSNQETPEVTDELDQAKLKSEEYPFSRKMESRSETKDSEPNYILSNVPVAADTNMDNLEETDKNIILVPMNSMESADIPSLTDEQAGGNEQIKVGTDYDGKKSENNHDITEINNEVDLTKFDEKQDNEFLNDEQDKEIPKIDSIEKESLQSVNGIISDEFDETDGDEKKIKNEDYTEGDELLLSKPKATFANAKPLIYAPQQSSSEESKSSSLLQPMINENRGLDNGPPVPSYNPETVKVVQRAVPMNVDMPESMPVVMVPISMEPQEQVQEDNEEDTKSLKINMDEEDIPDIINRESNKNILDLSMSNKDGKFISKEDTFKPSSAQTPENTGKPFSETKVVSFADVPLENIVDRSYGRTPLPMRNYQHNLYTSLENQIELEKIKKDIEELEALSNESNEKRAIPKTDETYSTKDIPMPVLLMTPEGELQPLDKNMYSTDLEGTESPQIDTLPLKMSQTTDEKADYEMKDDNENNDKNSQDIGEKEDGNVSRYKLLEKLVSPQEVSTNKPNEDEATEKSKADLEKERKERLQLLKKQIAEIRETFRAQVKEEGLKAALQRREEEMRNYLNQEKEFKKKFYAYPLVNHDHNILSRPRRLSYFPESDFSDEEDCDYLDQKIYKRRTDSYGVPILDDYEKSYLAQQVISAPPRNSENNHIFFPLDPKTPQALVYDDKIIPAKFFGVLSMNEEPTGTKPNTVINRQILDSPADNECQKCLSKQYDSNPSVKESYGPKILDNSFETYSLPKDTFIKPNNQPNYIPIIVLSTPINNHRNKRSIDDNLHNQGISKRDTKPQTDLKKRSIEQLPPFERNVYLDRSYDYLNEIPMKTDNFLNSIDYNHSNDMTIPKSNDINANKFSNGYPEFLPLKNQPTDYIPPREHLFHGPPIWNDLKVTNDLEQRHFLPPHPSPIAHPLIPDENSQEKDSPKLFFWSLMQDKFKSMLEMLQSLAEWCNSSSKK